MYFAVYKYKSKIDVTDYYDVENNSVYILDTSDWSVEKVSMKDIRDLGISVINISFYGDESVYSIVEANFIEAMYDNNELKVKLGREKVSGNSNSVCTYFESAKKHGFILELNGIRLKVVVDTSNENTEVLYVNGEELVWVMGKFEFNYAFLFREYIVLRFTMWEDGVYETKSWFSIAIGKDGVAHFWSYYNCNDSVGLMIDLISEV